MNSSSCLCICALTVVRLRVHCLYNFVYVFVSLRLLEWRGGIEQTESVFALRKEIHVQNWVKLKNDDKMIANRKRISVVPYGRGGGGERG